jgi:2-polyprenyl-6-methoxyphenol hydroxylase-like FAD-dependent oxidoreductase
MRWHPRSNHPGTTVGTPAHVPRWSRGRLVAIGDAVHGTSPSIGQGASLALEDAMVLARYLSDAADHRQAFADFQRLRQPRAERMVSYAQEVNKYKRISTNLLAVWLRDALVPLFLRKAARDTTNRWIYDYQIDWDSSADRQREHAQAHC